MRAFLVTGIYSREIDLSLTIPIKNAFLKEANCQFKKKKLLSSQI